jgi:uncharacterized protein YndB with AHSA1/START domain
MAQDENGSFETVDGRPAVRFERRLRRPVDAVWRAVTEPDELAHWFPAAVTVDLRLGGAIAFAFADDDGSPAYGEVTELEAPHRFAFTWGGDLIRFELEALDGGAGCRLRFTNVLGERDAAARTAAGWHVCLRHLVARLDGVSLPPPAPDATPEWRAAYDGYVEQGIPAGAPIPGA